MNELDSTPVQVTPEPSGAKASAPGGGAPDDTKMTRTYVRVIIVEAAIIIALLFFGRLFS